MNEVLPFHDRSHIDKVRWRKPVFVKVILHVPKHPLISLIPQLKEIKARLLHVDLPFRDSLKEDLAKRRQHSASEGSSAPGTGCSG